MPPATINTPTPSTLVPMISMTCRKDSMPGLIAGKRGGFQCHSGLRVEQSLLSLENNGRHGVVLGVAQSNKRSGNTTLRGKLFRWPGKNNKWFAARFFLNVDVAPAHRFADARAERLGNRLFRRKARSEMARRKFHGHRVCDLAFGKDALEKAIAETLQHALNARTLDKVNACANHAHAFTDSERCIGEARPASGRPLRRGSGRFAFGVWSARDTFSALRSSGRGASSTIFRHGADHLLHRRFETHPERARDDRVTDVELCQARDLKNERNVPVIDAVTGVDLQVRFRSGSRRGAQLFQFFLFDL